MPAWLGRGKMAGGKKGIRVWLAVVVLSVAACQRASTSGQAGTAPAPVSGPQPAATRPQAGQPLAEKDASGNDPSAPWRPAGARVTPLGPNIALGIAGDRRWVEIQAKVCLTAGYLEHLLSRDEAAKQHESILSTSIDASHIHAALIAAGAQPGRPVQYVNAQGKEEFRPPTGDRIRVTVHYKDASGGFVSLPAQRWVRNARTGKELDLDWVFAGSFFYKPEDSDTLLYAANDGRIITTANFPSALLDLPIRSAEGDPQAGLDFEANTELIPPRDTPVTVVLEVIKESAKDARKFPDPS